MAREYLSSSINFDLILATDMIDLTTFLALTREKSRRTPVILYMHENQLTYPLPSDSAAGPMRRQQGERDLHYAFINFSSMLAADLVLFNSNFHRDQLLSALPLFLRGFPEFNETETHVELLKKCSVFPIGIEAPKSLEKSSQKFEGSVPLIIWNQRWEYDKNPKEMFEVLFKLAERGLSFKIAICGQNFRNRPLEFVQGSERLADRIVHFGYAKEDAYSRLLNSANLTFSTAAHEFFGVAVLEAISYETYPVLPNRLCYPEILPAQFHDACLYVTQSELIDKLTWALLNRDLANELAVNLAMSVQSYHWPTLAPQFDDMLKQAALA